jgi:hypothetical protein
MFWPIFGILDKSQPGWVPLIGFPVRTARWPLDSDRRCFAPSTASPHRPTFVPSALSVLPPSRRHLTPPPPAPLGWQGKLPFPSLSRQSPLHSALCSHLSPAPPMPQVDAQPRRSCAAVPELQEPSLTMGPPPQVESP